ncbi:MAG: hypothetical protein QHH43_10190 [Candidatus Saccharicenans sp.]|nr:hypothetical protein [Candidatus Saccharicenans sp.]MDH7576111.1 hypothetical protein [Candidatus Saccharicenans sp.]
MSKRLFLFITPDGVTYSSPERNEPDVDNYQVLGYGEGKNEEEAFDYFISQAAWLNDTKFEEVISVEIKHKIYEGKHFNLK